ncbi:MAG: ATP-binding protein [candidate division KSB1 bacterium]|nr:ATP-binding protein [candidate division KSB1 bacterium]
MIAVRVVYKIGFIFFLLVAIVIGLWGISRVWVRSDVPFKWENRGGHVVVTEVLVPTEVLLAGDVVLRLGHISLQSGEEIEFALDGTAAGDTISARVQRGGGELEVRLALRHRNTWRYTIVNLILGLFIIAIGAWVFFNKSHEQPARIFFGLAFSLGMAILISTARLPAGPRPWVYILPVLYWFVYPLFPAFFLHFMTIFPREKSVLPSPKLQTLLIYSPAVVFIALLQFFHLTALRSRQIEHFRDYYQVFNAHRFYIIIFFLAALATLIHSYRTAESSGEKDKVRWILWGIAMGCAPFIVLWSIPLVLGAPPLVPEEITSLALLITPLSFAFAIVKYHLLDIDAIINRSIVYGLLTGLIVGAYVIVSGLAGHLLMAMTPDTSRTITILSTLAAALLFNPAKQKMQHFVDRTLYRVKYNYRLVTKEFAQRMVATRTQAEVLSLLTQHFHAAVPIEKMAFLVNGQDKLEIIASHGMTEAEKGELVSSTGQAMLKLAKQIELETGKESHIAGRTVLRESFAGANWEILLRLTMNTGERGILLLGRKLSGGKYLEEDLELFAALATEAFNAMARIRFQEAAVQERAEREKLEALNRLKDEKNRELELKNQEIIRAQEKLITQEKLASLGALTAGIAHEIKNPLNFVNNFAALSVELAKELREELVKRKAKNVNGDDFVDIAEILDVLEQNAEKINHHGKRADSIVRSMMMHSRGQIGQREMTDVNYLLDEAVNLTYHGLRAQDVSFNIAIEKQYDETIGKIEVVPQDLQRVFLNIINNACYAAHQKARAGDGESGRKGDRESGRWGENESPSHPLAPSSRQPFTPTLSVSTKNLGDQIEIRIRDNGNGIPKDIREKIFNPFFTTKPTGQGTGLGLSISYDIIVQQHRGEIRVETEEGKFTEFVVKLPRYA